VTLAPERRAALTRERLAFNAPLSDDRAERLVALLASERPRSVLDLGCGTGGLLLRVAAATAGEADGVDLDARALALARRRAGEHGLRATFHDGDITTWTGAADAVLCVAAEHAFGGAAAALAALPARVAPGGRLLFGAGCWTAPPGDGAREIFGDLPTFADLCAAARSAGWRVLHAGTATLREWDDFESEWRVGLELAPEPEARQLADERLREYVEVYRGVAGFAWLVLAP
jgi:SAM-dependent methyltransferase